MSRIPPPKQQHPQQTTKPTKQCQQSSTPPQIQPCVYQHHQSKLILYGTTIPHITIHHSTQHIIESTSHHHHSTQHSNRLIHNKYSTFFSRLSTRMTFPSNLFPCKCFSRCVCCTWYAAPNRDMTRFWGERDWIVYIMNSGYQKLHLSTETPYNYPSISIRHFIQNLFYHVTSICHMVDPEHEPTR